MELIEQTFLIMCLQEAGHYDVWRDGFETLAEAEIALVECQDEGGEAPYITQVSSYKITTADLDSRRVAEIMAAVKDGVA